MPGIGDDIAALAPLRLSGSDHVSIYAMDCGLMRSLKDMQAESKTLKMGADALLQSWTNRGRKRDRNCREKPVNLWDAIGHVAGKLGSLPGRRVILVVTDGNDRGSTLTWNEARGYAQVLGVAVFAIATRPSSVMDRGQIPVRKSDANALQAICELSGGMVRIIDPDSMGKTLRQTMDMVKGRYIVEFPRPSNSTSGLRDMQIKIELGEDYFIRPSGISVPVADPSLRSDPSTVPAHSSRAPEQGNRRVLQPN